MTQTANGTRKSGRKALMAAVAIIAIAAAGAVGYKITLENKITAALEKRGGKASSISADFLGRIHLTDVTLPVKNGAELKVQSITARPQFLLMSGMLEANDFSTEVGSYKIAIPHFEINDANFDLKNLSEIFGNRDLTLAERFGRFSANAVRISQLEVAQKTANISQNIRYKDVILNNIQNGKIAEYQSEGADFSFNFEVSAENDEPVFEEMNGSIGRAEGKDIDGVFLARLYTEAAGVDDKQAQLVYGPMTVKDIVLKTKDVLFSYDEVRSSGVSMRMPEIPLNELLEKIEAVTDIDALSESEKRAYIQDGMNLFDVVEKFDFDVVGFKIKPVDPKAAVGAIDRLSFAMNDQALDFSIAGLSAGDDKDYIKMEEWSWKGFSWAPSFAALNKFLALSEIEASSFPYTTLLPEFGSMEFKGISADLPTDWADDETAAVDNLVPGNEEAPATEDNETSKLPERIQFAVKSYAVSLTEPYNGIPTKISTGYEDITIPVPQDGQDEFYEQLRKLGYDKLVLSSKTKLYWDQPNQNLVIEDISVSGQGMGSFALSGLVGGFTKEFFSGDEVLTQVAALGLKARTVKLKIEDEGLIEKGLKLYASENEMSEAEARQMLTSVLELFVGMVGAEQPQLQEAASAFSQFLAKPNSFELSLTSKNPQGIGALQLLAASQNPLLLLDKVNIEAKTD